MKGKSEESSCT